MELDRREFGEPATEPLQDNAHKLAWEFDEEEKELWMQLRRKRDFESRVAEKRAQLQDLRDRRRKVSAQHAEVAASVEQLRGELAFTQEQEKEVERDIAVLAESNRILQQTFMQQHGGMNMPGGHQGSLDPSAILAEEKNRQESIQLQHEQIAHLRAHLTKLRAEKADLLRRQQFLFEKQRSAEQDRNRLLGTLQDDRGHINEVRQERIRLWEDRSQTEREMAQIVHDAHMNVTRAGNSDGVIYGDIANPVPASMSVAPAPAPNPPSPRAGWAGFGADQGSALNAQSNTTNTLPAGGGITEWSHKMREFRTSGF